MMKNVYLDKYLISIFKFGINKYKPSTLCIINLALYSEKSPEISAVPLYLQYNLWKY